MTADKYKIDMCHGAILPKLILFTVPIMAANVLQLIFHIIDLTVIGRFASGTSLAAIGATFLYGLTGNPLGSFFLALDDVRAA